MQTQVIGEFETAKSKKPSGHFLRRILMGGGLGDLGRLPRYAAFAILGGTLIWAPITGYLKTAPLSYKSTTSLILPGSGASASLNLNGIGQASSSANSAFASNAVSPTETYKRLLGADRILDAASRALDIPRRDLGQPRIELVDQTSLIKFEMMGSSSIDSQIRGEAILDAFFVELDALRADEQTTREDSGLQAIADYRASVAATRDEISALQSASGLLSVDQYQALLGRNAELENEVRGTRAALREKEAAVAGIEAQLGLTALNAARTLKLFADGGYLALMDEAALFSAALAEANSQYGARHPRVVVARQAAGTALATAQIRARFVTSLDDIALGALDLAPQGARADLLAQVVRMDAERAGLTAQLATIEEQLKSGSAGLARTATAAAQLQDLERDFSVAEAVFASAIARAQSTKSDVFASYPLVQVLENPSLPENPSSPNRKLAIAAGIAATLMLLLSLSMGWIRRALIGRLLEKAAGRVMIAQNPAERFVYRTIVMTWPFYAIGALYVVGPVIAWLLGGLVVVVLYFGPAVREDLQATGVIPPVVWAWLLGMSVMLVALWIGHLDWGLGLKQTIKSSIGWAKGWALLALFPLIGAVLPIRREVLVRGQCVVGMWTLILAPILVIAPYIGLPERIFTSPLKAIGGPGPEYFSVYFFTYDPSSWTPRWQFYAPWSPFAALLGVVMVLFALEEKNRNWKALGVAAGTFMILASKSRMGLVGLVACTIGPRMMPLFLRSWAWQVVAGLTASLAVFGPAVMSAANNAVSTFKGARADSTRVRETLQRIAKERWENEAVWFGHGTIHPGSHAVEYMPIGSHHTWFGLLFVKGLVGVIGLLVPFVWQTGLAMKDATLGPRGRLPMGIMMTLTLLSFGENIEIEAYLLWPALMLLGIHARELNHEAQKVDPLGD